MCRRDPRADEEQDWCIIIKYPLISSENTIQPTLLVNPGRNTLCTGYDFRTEIAFFRNLTFWVLIKYSYYNMQHVITVKCSAVLSPIELKHFPVNGR